jgi:choloylglycine hydrolase
MNYRLIVLITVLLFVQSSKLTACTGILLQAQDSKIVNGRTVEFSIPLEMSVAVIPRNFEFIGKTPIGSGMPYKSKYAAMGVYCFSHQVLMDGMNEEGLVAGAFYFPGYAGYTKVTIANQKKALSPVDFTNWILTQFSSVDEVKKGIQSIVIAPTVLSGWGNAPPPMHYIVYDKSGESIVIEPINGELIVYDNPNGIITNSPTFDWHLTNLNNYLNLSAQNASSTEWGEIDLTSFGQGSGLLGMPGDFTPPSRFVRASFFAANAVLAKSSHELLNQTFHILNQFDIPYGSVRQKGQTLSDYERTQFTSVKDPNALKYYYKSYQDQGIKFIDLKQFDLNAKSIRSMLVQGSGTSLDVSTSMK